LVGDEPEEGGGDVVVDPGLGVVVVLGGLLDLVTTSHKQRDQRRREDEKLA
jgi:hypothetical protein